MKVLMIGSVPENLQEIKGGVEATIVNLLEGFKLINDIEVILVSFSNKIKERKIIECSSNIKIYYLPFKSPKFQLLDYFLNRKTLKKIIYKFHPDIIHIQAAAPHLLRLFGFSKKNIVVTQHGIMQEEYKLVKGLKNKLKFIFKIIIEKYYFPTFKNIIFISKYNYSLFSLKKSHKFALIKNPINKIFYVNNCGTSALNNIIYVGCISNLKNIILLLKAIKLLRVKGVEYNLTIVGNFKESAYKRKVIEYIGLNEIHDIITFKGQLSQNSLNYEMIEHNIFVLPSKQENMPICIAEAMASGKVVVASDVGAVSEMFENNKSGYLFEKNNLNELIGLLERLYDNKKLINKISKEAKKVALNNYHPAKIAKETIEFYKKVIYNNDN